MMDTKKVYLSLLKKYGQQGWWPLFITQDTNNKTHRDWRVENGLTYGISYLDLKKHQTGFRDPCFEIAVGAILTQNTAWKNVAVAIINLYKAKALTPQKLLKLPTAKLQKLIRPAGYFRQKTKKLKLFAEWLIKNHDGEIKQLGRSPSSVLRSLLLARWGIGRETADSIILYALNKPVFVIDEYTRRLCRRYGVEFEDYDEYRQFFEKAFLKQNYSKQRLSKIYQEYHGLIVRAEKIFPSPRQRRGRRPSRL
ncbi:MAG: endonuclease [Candidatus Magasanikbacteria bacterium]|nr:endonuclease [Candidatus Magasanikbacteria bacterium]